MRLPLLLSGLTAALAAATAQGPPPGVLPAARSGPLGVAHAPDPGRISTPPSG